MSWLPDWITGFDRENFEAGRRADERNRQITEDLHDRGIISDKDYAVANEHYDAAAAYDPDADIESAFDEGWNEGANNIRGALGGVFDKVGFGALKIIPWQVWLAGAVYLGWKMGWFKGLLKKG